MYKIFKFIVGLIITIVFYSCSTAKQLNNKWIGKTDQEVVNKFGMPDSVANFENKGKIYFYNIVSSSHQLSKHPVTNGKLDNAYPVKRSFYVEKNIFFIDSLNKVNKVLSIDSNYTKGNFYYIKY